MTSVAFNVLGGAVWGSGVALLGYLAGSSFDAVARSLGRTSAGLLAVLVLAGLVTWVRRRRRRPVRMNASDECAEPVQAPVPG